MVCLHVIYDQVFLGKLDFQQLDTVQQLFPLNQLLGDFLGAVPLFVGRGDILRGGDSRLQAHVLRLQVQGAGDVGSPWLRLMLLGKHSGITWLSFTGHWACGKLHESRKFCILSKTLARRRKQETGKRHFYASLPKEANMNLDRGQNISFKTIKANLAEI